MFRNFIGIILQVRQSSSVILSLAGSSVLGNSLSSFRDGVLGQFTGENQSDSSLDFSSRQGLSVGVSGESSSFRGDSLKHVVDERVHDGHGSSGDSGIGVHLSQHLVDVRREGLNSLSLGRLLLSSGGLFSGGALRSKGLSSFLGWHV
jgi:hypothetical protein